MAGLFSLPSFIGGIAKVLGGKTADGDTAFLAHVLVNSAGAEIGTDTNPLKVAGAGAGGGSGGTLGPLVTGQVKIATTGTPVQLPAAALVSGLAVTAKGTNSPQTPSYSSTVGGSSAVTTINDGTGNGYPLAPGGSASVACANANQVWVNGTIGDVFAYIGS